MFKPFKPLVALSLVLAAGLASATTIGFGKLSNKSFTDDYLENGYELRSSTANMFAAGSPKFLVTTGFTFESASSSPFDLKSFDLDFGNASDLVLSYTFADGTSTTIALKDKANDFYKFNLDDLTSFTLSGTLTTGRGRNKVTSPADFLVDDIKVTAFEEPTAVPEPGAIALMLAGIAMIGTVSRRRRA